MHVKTEISENQLKSKSLKLGAEQHTWKKYFLKPSKHQIIQKSVRILFLRGIYLKTVPILEHSW